MEEVIEHSLNLTYLYSDSSNLLFYGEAMLGKVGASLFSVHLQTCAVRKVLKTLAKRKVPLFYHLYGSVRGFAGFVDDLCNPDFTGPDKFEALHIALRKYNDTLGEKLKSASEKPGGLLNVDFLHTFYGKNALIVIDFADGDYNGADKLAIIAKIVRDLNYPVRF